MSRVGATSVAVTIGLTWSGSATVGTDYTLSVVGGQLSTDRRSLTLPAGVTSAVLTVIPVDDTLVESPETVVVTLLAGTGYVLGSQASATGTIADNDVAPTLPAVSIVASDPVGAEVRAGQTVDPVTFTLTRHG